ncbi:unnamed protein product, partial [Ixodes hexagonus]
MSKLTVFVTGGAGYVGSHVIVDLLDAGCDVVVADNFYNSRPETKISPFSSKFLATGIETIQIFDTPAKPSAFYSFDFKYSSSTRSLLPHRFDCVIHTAGYKSVGESWKAPLGYYRNNIGGTINLLD